jgi:hypothetical protein
MLDENFECCSFIVTKAAPTRPSNGIDRATDFFRLRFWSHNNTLLEGKKKWPRFADKLRLVFMKMNLSSMYILRNIEQKQYTCFVSFCSIIVVGR